MEKIGLVLLYAVTLAVGIVTAVAAVKWNDVPIVYKDITGKCLKASSAQGEPLSCKEAMRGRHDTILSAPSSSGISFAGMPGNEVSRE